MATGVNLVQPQGSAATFSRTYDNAVYTTVDEITGNIAAAVNSSFIFTAVAQKQVKSVTLVPSTAPVAADQVQLTLYSLYAQAFGTATGAASPSLAGGTATSTSYNKVSIFLGTGVSFTAWATNSPLYNPIYVNLSGAKGTVVVAGPGGTNTQGGYTFLTGPNGGLTMNPGDIIVLAKATDSVGVFAVTVETAYTPGTTFTL
jgi:hypothetical protein